MLSQEDVRRVPGRLDDPKVAGILKLSPTLPISGRPPCVWQVTMTCSPRAHHTSGVAEGIVEIVPDGKEDLPSR